MNEVSNNSPLSINLHKISLLCLFTGCRATFEYELFRTSLHFHVSLQPSSSLYIPNVCKAYCRNVHVRRLLDGSNHYSKMIALKDARGENVFESMAITLVCDSCLRSE